MKKLIQRVRTALPEAAILIMSPMDRGMKDESGEIVTAPTIPRIVEKQQKVAEEMNVAFFNTFQAMGGEGTMARWAKRDPRLVGGDYIHPRPEGAKMVGDLFYEGLREQFIRYKLRRAQQGMKSEPKPASDEIG